MNVFVDIDSQKYYLDLFFDEFISKPTGPDVLCNIAKQPNVSESDNLINWISHVNKKFVDKKIHHLFWLMMPEKEMPSKDGKKFVGNIQLDFSPDSCNPLKSKKTVTINFMGEEKEAKILIMRYFKCFEISISGSWFPIIHESFL